MDVFLSRSTGLPLAQLENRQARLTERGKCIATVIQFASHILFVSLRASVSHAATLYPPPSCADSHDSLSCNSGLVVLGDSKSAVYEKCGPPQHIDKGCVPGRRQLLCWDIWTYRPNASYFPRYVSFEKDIVVGIQSGSRFE